jgi:hypothetical protein
MVGKMTRIKIVVDAHNASIPTDGNSRTIMNWVLSKIISNANITIVTNNDLALIVRKKGGTPFVLPDPVPVFSEMNNDKVFSHLAGKINILFICSFADDEPYMEVIEASRGLKDGVHIYISGDSRKYFRKTGSKHANGNITLTGFLSEQEFVSLLHQVDIIIDLTTRENCLVCGAYEAVGAGKPMILSDTAALRGYFSKGAIYTNNSAEDIRNKITTAILNCDNLKEDVNELRGELISSWENKKRQFEETLELIAN